MSISCTALRSAILTEPRFSFPWGRCSANRAKFCMDRKTLPCLQKARSMYPSIYNSFPVIRTTIIAKIVIFTYPGLHFLFALATSLWQSRKMLHEWKDNSVLAKPLAACTQLSSTVSQLFEPQVQKVAVFTYSSPHFCFPWRRPCDYHAIWCMGGKTIQCLPNPSQHVPIYIQ